MMVDCDAGLSDQDRQILDYAAVWRGRPGDVLAGIRPRLNMTVSAYFQRLNALLDDPAAAAAHPGLVARLRRVRNAARWHL